MAESTPDALHLTEDSVLDEIYNYFEQHPNDFGTSDGRERIPMKKLMKLFAIKKKSPLEKQNLFRTIVNGLCDLELIDGIGKVLVLKSDGNSDLGYGDAAPTVSHSHNRTSRSASINSTGSGSNIPQRSARFLPPGNSTSSSNLSVATESGVFSTTTSPNPNNGNGNNGGEQQNECRRIGYRRRGSVTRYSIVAQDAVLDEYKKHEEMIQQFRRQSLEIGQSMRNLSLGLGNDEPATSTASTTSTIPRSSRHKPKPTAGGGGGDAGDAEGGAVKRFFRRGRFSLAF